MFIGTQSLEQYHNLQISRLRNLDYLRKLFYIVISLFKLGTLKLLYRHKNICTYKYFLL